MLRPGSARGAVARRLRVSASGRELWGGRLLRRRRMGIDLPGGQVRRGAVLQIRLAHFRLDADAVVRRERAEVVRTLAVDAGVRIDEHRRRAGLLIGAAVLVRLLDGEDERGVAVLRVDVRGE